MKDILIGVLIMVGLFFVIDFIYTEKNQCLVPLNGYKIESQKCGFIKEHMDKDIYLFGRYW